MMKVKIRSLIAKVSLTNFTDKLFSPSQRLILINSVFVFVVIGFIAGTLLRGCGASAEQQIKVNVSTNH